MMSGTNLTTTVSTDEGTGHVFVAVDHRAHECADVHAPKKGTRFEALRRIRRGVRERYGRFDADVAAGLAVGHDRGPHCLAEDLPRRFASFQISHSSTCFL